MKIFVNYHCTVILKTKLIIVFFFSIVVNMESQIKIADSLRYFRINSVLNENIKKGNFNQNILLLKSELNDLKYHKSLKPMIYNDLAANYGMGGKIDSAKYFTELSILFCEKNDLKTNYYYKALYNKSNILILNKNADEALKICYILLDYFKKTNPDLFLNTLINTGNILLDLRSFEESYDYLELAEKEAKDKKNYHALFRVYHNMAQLEYYKNLRTVNEKCISYAELSLETAFKTNRQNIVIDAKSNLGTYYWKIGKFSRAIELLISADSFYTQKNINKTSVLTSLSKAYFMAGEYDKSKFYLEKIKPDDNLLNNVENKILSLSIENKSDTYRDFVLYKSLLDSNIIEETKLQVRTLNKKFKLLEKEHEIKNLNEINLLNRLKAQDLEVENFKQSTKNDNLSKEKLLVENELKDKTIIETKNKLEITTLSAEKKISELNLKEQKKILLGSIVGLVLISILSMLLYRQSRNRNAFNQILARQNDQIQLLHQELNHRVKNN
ncbi:MAG TPA: hypothetical protein PKD51_19280, partial [Saprospiraceae bacterium]|nr:hypothetical protein [Saprospiraceae bacterium]